MSRQPKRRDKLSELATGWRLLIAAGWTLIAGVICAGGWMVGILMFTFSLDGASPSDVPQWLEIYMLVGWPILIGLAVVIPALMIACGACLSRILVTFVVLGLLSVATAVACWFVVVL